MKRMIGVGEFFTSSISPLSRFSNSPFTPAPACSSARSSVRSVTFLQRRRHVALRDAQREAFDHRRLADARLADEDRIVLPAAREDVDDLPDLEVAAEHRVDLALPSRARVRSTVYWSRFGVLAAAAGARRRAPPADGAAPAARSSPRLLGRRRRDRREVLAQRLDRNLRRTRG